MIETPERIWGHIDGDVGSWGRNWVFDEDVEYIRADLVEELEAKLAKVKEAFRINMMDALPDYTHEMFDKDYAKIIGETDA